MEDEKRKLIMEMMQNTTDTAMQSRLAEILVMPPDEQDAALADLTRAYEPEREDLRDELSRNYDMLTAEGPKGQMAGNNQFSVYVGANPLEHLASGVSKYRAGKGVKEGRAEQRELSKQQGAAQKAIMSAQAEALSRSLRGQAGSGQSDRFPNETDEEYWRRTGKQPQVGI